MSAEALANLEAEEAVLGAMLVREPAIGAALATGLSADDFYSDRHRAVFRAIAALHERGEPADPVTVPAELERTGKLAEAGGRDAVVHLASTTPAPANAGHYASIVRECSTRRRLRELGLGLADLDGRGTGEAAEWAREQLAAISGAQGASGGEAEAIRRALLEDPQPTTDASGPAREELPGTGGLVHRGQAALFFADRGAGKSIVALIVGLGAAVAGARVYYFDRENGAEVTRERAEAIIEATGWPDVLADGRFEGRHYPQLSRDWHPEAFGEALGDFGLVIYDSLREAISQLDGDPNSDADVSRFVDLAVTPLRRRGVAVLILDNTGHEAKERPKGSGSKLDAIPQAYKVRATEPFSAALTGRVELTCTRSRSGDVDRRWTARIGRGVYEVPASRDEAPDAKAARELRERREAFRRACIEALREEAPRGRDDLIAAARKRGVSGRNQALRDSLAEFAADPSSGLVSSDDGWSLTPGPDDVGQGGATPSEDPPGPEPALPKGAGRVWGPGPDSVGQGGAAVELATAEEEARAARLSAVPVEGGGSE